ncbi:chemotaxis protein CheB [Runella zeae]|uniref:chemotaxis protein CheB n=1 Tax=Runella zeae TaxID=94255 RepID=UPI00235626D5|nr:chemotaxis protein CheB [Runella zeae]
MQKQDIKMVVIGGSAGSLPVIMSLLEALPEIFSFTVVIVIHRSKNVLSEMDKLLSHIRNVPNVHEPDDKEPILGHRVYLAPQNYHLLIETNKTFSLDYSEPISFSRPSIDVTFESVAQVYAQQAVGILLSGANTDGTKGVAEVIRHGGIGIVQDPTTAEYPIMPHAALLQNQSALCLPTSHITTFLKQLNDNI